MSSSINDIKWVVNSTGTAVAVVVAVVAVVAVVVAVMLTLH